MLWSAFLLGFLGSFHCVVMCAPIMISIKWHGIKSLTILRNKLIYQSGRIITYIFIGLLFYVLGRSFALASFQKALSITVGSILILWLLFDQLKLNQFNSLLLSIFNWAKKLFLPLTQIKGAAGSFATGLLNGLLPCGLVYVAAFASVLQISVTDNIKYMTMFGIGTLPLILIVLAGAQFAGNSVRKFATRFTPIFIGLLGLYFITRGLELNIPYLSPSINVVNDSTATCAPINP